MVDDSPGPAVPLRTSARIKEKRRRSLPARTSSTAVKKRSVNSVNVQPASTEVIASLIDTLSAISTPAEHHFDNLSMTAASQSTPSTPYPWQSDYNLSRVSKDGYLYKRNPSFSARAGFGMEQNATRRPSYEGSHLHPDNAVGIEHASSTPSRRTSNNPLRKSYIASSVTRRERDDDESSIGCPSIEPGQGGSTTDVARTEITRVRGRRSYKDLKLKMSKDRMRENHGWLHRQGRPKDHFTKPFCSAAIA